MLQGNGLTEDVIQSAAMSALAGAVAFPQSGYKIELAQRTLLIRCPVARVGAGQDGPELDRARHNPRVCDDGDDAWHRQRA